jgi:hypothetical protein
VKKRGLGKISSYVVVVVDHEPNFYGITCNTVKLRVYKPKMYQIRKTTIAQLERDSSQQKVHIDSQIIQGSILSF